MFCTSRAALGGVPDHSVFKILLCGRILDRPCEFVVDELRAVEKVCQVARRLHDPKQTFMGEAWTMTQIPPFLTFLLSKTPTCTTNILALPSRVADFDGKATIPVVEVIEVLPVEDLERTVVTAPKIELFSLRLATKRTDDPIQPGIIELADQIAWIAASR